MCALQACDVTSVPVQGSNVGVARGGAMDGHRTILGGSGDHSKVVVDTGEGGVVGVLGRK